MKTPPELDAIADAVVGRQPLKAIAGAPDRPLVIGDIAIPCYVLEDETRVLSQRGFQTGVGMSTGGSTRGRGARRIQDFIQVLSKKGLETSDLPARAFSPIEFQPTAGGRTAYAYPATFLVDFCNLVLAARAAGMLHKPQLHIAERAEALISALAKVGIIALVDEATGYQRIRSERALATILERFIAEELQPWTRTFPYEFYEQIFRLKEWDGPHGRRRPRAIGHYTNDFVYARIAPGVLEELRERNPTLSQGWRKNRHHQWFTPDVGHPNLQQHIAAVTALMKAAPSWGRFKRDLDRVFPKIDTTLAMPLDLDED